MFCGSAQFRPEAQRKLLKYVEKNDLKSIEKLVSRFSEDVLNYEYAHPYHNHKILIIACNDENSMGSVKGETISKLIALGAECTDPTKNDNWEAIHYAAVNANKEKLSALLEHLNKEEANALVYCSKHLPKRYPFCARRKEPKTFSNNALHILLKYGNRNKDFKECCDLLVSKGVSVTQVDSNGTTPLDLMKEEKELEDILHGLSLGGEKKANKSLIDLIAYNHEKEFISQKLTPEQADGVDGQSEDSASGTLLQICAAKKLVACVKHLLNQGADPNKTIPNNRDSVIMIAMKEDSEEIVQLLLENSNLDLPKDILIKLQNKYKRKRQSAKIDKYMDIILGYLRERYNKMEIKKYLVEADELNRTALHYAINYECSDHILDMLKMGAPLTKKDIFGHTPLHSLQPDLFKEFLDSCVELPKDDEELDNMLYKLKNTKQKFTIEVNYESLISDSDEEEMHESEFLHYLIHLKKLKQFVNHPVISSYLAVKWQKFKWIVYTNLSLYFIAYGSLLFYGFGYNNYPLVANICLLVSLALIFLLCSIQMFIFRIDYFRRWDNIVNLALMGGIIYIIASGWIHTLLNQNLRVAFSVVFLMSTLGIFLQLGNLTFFTIKVIILREIALNFFKYMIFYIFPVLAFFFCFYMLRENDEDVFFETLYRVITMYAGDPDADYPEQFESNPVFSHIIYVCFVIIIGIILQNLLIGLAVSDLQEIQMEAEFIDKKERAGYVTSLERVVFAKLKKSPHGFESMLFKKILKTARIFPGDKILMIEPYNDGCVYVKENPTNKEYIQDQTILDLLQNIFKDLTVNKEKTDDEVDVSESLKVINDKLERIEAFLERLDAENFFKK